MLKHLTDAIRRRLLEDALVEHLLDLRSAAPRAAAPTTAPTLRPRSGLATSR